VPEYTLDRFLKKCREVVASNYAHAEIAAILAPAMLCLLDVADSFPEFSRFCTNPDHCARNLVFAAEDDSLPHSTLVWDSRQWKPIHSHGSWGVVGVHQGIH